MIEVKVKNNFKAALELHKHQSKRFLDDVGDAVIGEWKDMISEQDEGRSRPGEPPKIDSGDLIRSLQADVKEKAVLFYGADYATILEDHAGLNRPFISPGLHYVARKKLPKLAKKAFDRKR